MIPGPPDPAEEVVRAALDPSRPSSDPAVQLIELAMTGFGYNFYDAANVARANDVLVRQKVAASLAEAARAAARLERAYRERFIPPPSREQPYPSAEQARRATALHHLATRLDALASALLTFETPSPDAIWSRIREERSTLGRLLTFDVGLVGTASSISERVLALSAEACDADDALAEIMSESDRFERSFAERKRLLSA